MNVLLSEVPTIMTPKPQRIDLPHAIYSKDYDTRACLIVKDPEREFKDKIEDLNIPCFAEVIGYKRLMTDFADTKKVLCSSYDLFFSDIRVYRMLPKCLGREFYRTKKYPHPVLLDEENLEE